MKQIKKLKYLIALLMFLPVSLFANPNKLNLLEIQIKNYLLENKVVQLNLLEQLVNINSGTENIEGVRRVGEILRSEFDALDFKTRWIEEPADMHRAPTLIAEHKSSAGKRLLLVGHLDTVFPKNSPFQKFERHGNFATGPGIIDDKGGDVIILYALKALQATHTLDTTNITVVLTGDEEESGKPVSISRKPLIDIGKQNDIALDFEPTIGERNKASIARRGYTHWLIAAKGKEGHSSQIFKEDFGDGAIFELVRILNGMRTTLSDEKYLTFNPGIILGGTQISLNKTTAQGNNFGKDNVIAKIAMASGDLRYLTQVQKEQAKRKIEVIVHHHLPGTNATVEFQDSLPPMPPTNNNWKLLNQYSQISQKLGYGEVTPLPPDLKGGGDISYVAPYVQANLVGIGAIGTGEHSLQETLDVDSLVIQSQRAALLIYALTR